MYNKVIISISLSLIIIIVISVSCLANNKVYSTAELKELAYINTTINLPKGNYNKVYNQQNSDQKKVIKVEDIEEIYESSLINSGEYVSDYDPKVVNSEENFTKIETLTRYENMNLLIYYTYNDKGELINFEVETQTFANEKTSNEYYYEENLKYETSGGYSLDGMLTMPKDVINPPIVLLVAGSIPTDMNYTYEDASIFKDIAYGLAENGIATVRFNRRYWQYPKDSTDYITVNEDILDDNYDFIQYIKTFENVDNSNFYLLGHSMGGILTPNFAYNNNELKGVISMGGSLRHVAEIYRDQKIANINSNDSLTKEQKDELIQKVNESCEKAKTIDTYGSHNFTMDNSNDFWCSINESQNPMYPLNLKDDVRYLVLQGEQDDKVLLDKDFQSFIDILGDRPNTIFKSYNDLDHSFIDITKKDNHIPIYVIEDIANFINKNMQ